MASSTKSSLAAARRAHRESNTSISSGPDSPISVASSLPAAAATPAAPVAISVVAPAVVTVPAATPARPPAPIANMSIGTASGLPFGAPANPLIGLPPVAAPRVSGIAVPAPPFPAPPLPAPPAPLLSASFAAPSAPQSNSQLLGPMVRELQQINADILQLIGNQQQLNAGLRGVSVRLARLEGINRETINQAVTTGRAAGISWEEREQLIIAELEDKAGYRARGEDSVQEGV